MKQKKKSDVAVLLDYAGSHRGLTYLGLFLSAVSMLLSMAPYICIWAGGPGSDCRGARLDAGGECHPVRLSGICFCVGRYCDLFCRLDVYPSGGLPHGSPTSASEG